MQAEAKVSATLKATIGFQKFKIDPPGYNSSDLNSALERTAINLCLNDAALRIEMIPQRFLRSLCVLGSGKASRRLHLHATAETSNGVIRLCTVVVNKYFAIAIVAE